LEKKKEERILLQYEHERKKDALVLTRALAYIGKDTF